MNVDALHNVFTNVFNQHPTTSNISKTTSRFVIATATMTVKCENYLCPSLLVAAFKHCNCSVQNMFNFRDGQVTKVRGSTKAEAKELVGLEIYG